MVPEKIEEQDDRPEKIITDSSSAETAIITPTGCRATKETVFFVSSAVFFAALRVFSAAFAAAAAPPFFMAFAYCRLIRCFCMKREAGFDAVICGLSCNAF